MSVIKNFKIEKEHGLKLLNEKDRDQFLEEKIKFFSKYDNYMSKTANLELLQEILDMNIYDKATATFDCSEMFGTIGFNIDDHKDEIIYYYNFVVILGTIFLNVFDFNDNRLAYLEGGKNGPILTNEMLASAYYEMLSKKITHGTAYGATLILATLFEKDLKAKIKKEYAKDYLNDLNNKITSKIINITAEDEELRKFLVGEFITEIQYSKYFDGVISTTISLYDLLAKYNIINPSNKDIENMLKNRFTLGELLRSSLFVDKVDNRFNEVIQILFNIKKLNLRNNLAHCNYGYINYYYLSVTALFFGLYQLITDNRIMK